MKAIALMLLLIGCYYLTIYIVALTHLISVIVTEKGKSIKDVLKDYERFSFEKVDTPTKILIIPSVKLAYHTIKLYYTLKKEL